MAVWITRNPAVAFCCVLPLGCAHAPNQEPAPPVRASALGALHRASTGIIAFDAYVDALASSNDPVEEATAALLAELVSRAQRDEETRGPMVVAFVEPQSSGVRVLTDAVEVGLRKHPMFRVSDRRAFRAVGREQDRESGGKFDEATVQSVGAFHGAHAIGRVTIERIGKRTAIAVRLTSMRTLLVLADARITVDQPLLASATTDALRLSLRNARRIAEGRGPDGTAWCTPDGRWIPHICVADPALPACQEDLKGATPVPCPPSSNAQGEE